MDRKRSLQTPSATTAIYDLMEGSHNKVGGERSHDFAVIGLNHTLEGGDGSGNGCLRHEAKDAKHGKTAVVDLHLQAASLLLLGHVFAKLKRVVKVEGDRVGDSLSVRISDEVGEVTGLATSHVVLVIFGGILGPELKESNHGKDLPLRGVRDFVPKSRGVGVGGERTSIHLHRPGEFDPVGVGNETDESKHGNAAMLDLSVTEEANGRLFSCAPKISLGEIEGVKETNNGVELLGENLKISLTLDWSASEREHEKV